MTFRFGRHQPGRSNSENSEIGPMSEFSEFTWPYHRRHNSENSEVQPISGFSECRSAATIELLSEGPGSRIHCVGGTFTPWFFKLQPCTERMCFGVLLQRRPYRIPGHRRRNSENSEIQPISEFSECRSAATIELLSEGPGSRIHCVGGTFTPWFFKLQPCTERMCFGVLLQRRPYRIPGHKSEVAENRCPLKPFPKFPASFQEQLQRNNFFSTHLQSR